MEQIEIRTHEDFSNVSEKYYGFTLKQWLSIIITAVINIPLYIKLLPILGDELASWIVILIALPLMAFGFIVIQGLHFEQLVPYLYRAYIKFIKPLAYKTDKQIEEEKMAKKKKRLKEKKKASKQKTKKKKVAKVEEQPEVIEEPKISRKDKKQMIKAERKQAKENKKLEKQRVKELRLERKQAKELAKAKKKYGDLEANTQALNEKQFHFDDDNITQDDLDNIILLGKKAEQLQNKFRRELDSDENEKE